jgi:hypothetical protein
MICAECHQQFPSRRSLHAHIKAHGISVCEYYEKHYPKYDLLTGDKIICLDYERYIKQDFTCYANFKQWMLKTGDFWVKDFIKKKALEKIEEKKIELSPPDLFYTLSEMADISDYKRVFGAYSYFLKEVDIEPWFFKKMPNFFFERDFSDVEILIDTREQQPINFKHSIQSKLDFGDYTVGGELYSKTFVDRKAEGDFLSTFSGGIDRFRREMDRCVQFGSYMFVVVESSVDQINKDGNRFVKSLPFVWHNVKQLMLDYPRNVQFIFAGSRDRAKDIIPRILFYGEELWNVDVNYFIKEEG